MKILGKSILEEVKRAKRNIRRACKGCCPVEFTGWEIRVPRGSLGYAVLVVLYTSDAGQEEYRVAI